MVTKIINNIFGTAPINQPLFFFAGASDTSPPDTGVFTVPLVDIILIPTYYFCPHTQTRNPFTGTYRVPPVTNVRLATLYPSYASIYTTSPADL